VEASDFDPRSLVGRETGWVEVYADQKTLDRYQASSGDRMIGIDGPPSRWDRPILPAGFLAAVRPDSGDLIPDFGRVRLNAGNEYQWFAPVFAGEKLLRKTRVADVRQKQGRSGTMWFIVIESEYKRPDGQVVAVQRATTIRRI